MIPANICLQVCGRDQLGFHADCKRSAGVAPEVNLREHVTHTPLPSVNKVAHSGFNPRGDITRSPKQGYQWLHKNDSRPQKNFKLITGEKPQIEFMF